VVPQARYWRFAKGIRIYKSSTSAELICLNYLVPGIHSSFWACFVVDPPSSSFSLFSQKLASILRSFPQGKGTVPPGPVQIWFGSRRWVCCVSRVILLTRSVSLSPPFSRSKVPFPYMLIIIRVFLREMLVQIKLCERYLSTGFF